MNFLLSLIMVSSHADALHITKANGDICYLVGTSMLVCQHFPSSNNNPNCYLMYRFSETIEPADCSWFSHLQREESDSVKPGK